VSWNRFGLVASVFIVCLAITTGSVLAAAPVKEKQIVYGLTPWDGKEYSGTFAPQVVDTIYLLADVENIVNLMETEVYFWPITGEFMADWFGHREVIEGTLRVSENGKEVATYEKRFYAYSYPEGYGKKVDLLLDERAQAGYEDYQDAMDAYWDASSEYRDAKAEWDELMSKILKEVQETGQYKKEAEIPKPPKQPEAPKYYVSKPKDSFIVKLPAGNYTVEVVDRDGQVVPGSKKRLVVFKERREGIGYEIVPESKWTRPVNSDDPSQLMYAEGNRTIYVKPFYEKEYDRYFYTKMTKIHEPLTGQGTQGTYQWVHTKPVEDVKVQLLRNGQVVQEIERKPYYVKQTPGYALGYDIVEFDPDKEELAGKNPTFEAYKVEIKADETGSVLRIVDSNGNVVPGSVRTIRGINDLSGWVLYLIPFFTLVIGLVIYIWRRSLKWGTAAPGEIEGVVEG